MKKCSKSGRDPNALDFFEFGLAMAKCTNIYGASWWRESKYCARLADLACGRGKRLIACLLHVPFAQCTGYESNVHMLAGTHAVASRFDDSVRDQLPEKERASQIDFREATFEDTKDWVECDCVILDADRFARGDRDRKLERFASRAARMKSGSFAIVLASYTCNLRVPASAKRRHGAWILEDRSAASLSYGQVQLSIYRKDGGRERRLFRDDEAKEQ